MKSRCKETSALTAAALLIAISLSFATCTPDGRRFSLRSEFTDPGRHAEKLKNDAPIVLASSEDAVQAFKKIADDQTFHLETDEVQLKKTVDISASNVIIVGVATGTKIICPPNGDGFDITGSNIIFERIVFTKCSKGSAIYADKPKSGTPETGGADDTCTPSVTVRSCNFTENVAKFDPPFYAENRCVEVDNAFFLNNEAKKSGPAGIGAKSSNIIIKNATFEGNVGLDGAALYVQRTKVTILDSTFYKNTAKNQGGAIFAGDKCTLLANSSSFHRNVANETAGAIKVQKFSSLTTFTTSFRLNRAIDTGGAIASAQSTLEFTSSEFIGNYANRRGGAVEAYKKSTVSLKLSRFKENWAGVGGVVWSSGSTVVSDGSNFDLNAGTRDGGVFYAIANTNLTISMSDLVQNKAQFTGGGVTASGIAQLTVLDSKFEGNSVTGSGGSGAGISITDTETLVSRSSFFGNDATLKGGAVDIHGSSEMIVKYSNFTNNRARMGAAVSDRFSRVSVTNSSFESNRAQGEGGGFYADASTLLEIEESSFTGNRAFFSGGAVKLMRKCTATIKNVTFQKNHAAFKGGALSAHTSNVSIEIANFEKNHAVTSSGALHLYEKSLVLLSDVLLWNNSAEIGGAVGISNARVLARRTKVSENSATAQAGGISVGGKSSLDMAESLIEKNTVTGTGGGVKVNSPSTFSATQVLFSNNEAETTGGGIVGYGAVLVFSDSSFRYNFAGTDGGAIEVYSKSSVSITDSDFIGNSAEKGGAVTHWDSRVEVNTAAFESNKAAVKGGAIYSAFRAKLTIEEATFVYNSAAENGGAMAADDCLLDMKAAEFDGNSAKNYGGALSWAGKSSANIDQATFSRNSAENGGAIDVKRSPLLVQESLFETNAVGASGGACFVNDKATMTVTRTRFTENTASDGGAIFLNRSKLFANESLFNSNAAQDIGGAICTAEKDCVVHVVTMQFEENTAQNAGGALYLAPSSDAHVNETLFKSNRVVQGAPGGHGGDGQSNRIPAGDQNGRSMLSAEESTSSEALRTLNSFRPSGGSRQTLSQSLTDRSADYNGVNGVGMQANTECSVVYGGTIAAVCPKVLIVSESTFNANLGNEGGAIGINAGENKQHLHINNCTFDGNMATDGAAVFVRNGISTLEIGTDIVFTNNLAVRGGGLCLVESAELEVAVKDGAPLRFSHNAAYYGGGLYCKECNVELTHPVEFIGNLALERGGGAYFERAGYKTAIYKALFDYNAASLGAGLALTDCEHAKIGGSVNLSFFYRNIALMGGGVFLEIRNITRADYQVRHTVISYNEALDWDEMKTKKGSVALAGWQQLRREAEEAGDVQWPTCDDCDYGSGGGFYAKVDNFDEVESLCRLLHNVEVDDNEAVVGDDGVVEFLDRQVVVENLIVNSAYVCLE